MTKNELIIKANQRTTIPNGALTNMNYMEKVSRSIIHKEKESIRFFLGEENTLEQLFINKLRKRPFMLNLDNVYTNILRLFNNACYICTLVYQADYPQHVHIININNYSL